MKELSDFVKEFTAEDLINEKLTAASEVPSLAPNKEETETVSIERLKVIHSENERLREQIKVLNASNFQMNVALDQVLKTINEKE